MFRPSLLLIAFALSAGSVSEAQIGACKIYTGFKPSDETRQWRAVNDGVMGGLSSGGPSFKDGYMVFEGVINTNGGGFSSLRSPVQYGALAEATGIKLRVKSDGRGYKMTFRTNLTYRGRLISFQSPIPQTPHGEWAEVTVPFNTLRGSIFGRPLRGASFDRNEVREMGFILADGQDGPFRLVVDWIGDCSL